MTDQTLKKILLPELGFCRSGKVRDIYQGETTLLIAVSDRISAFNRLFNETIPDKGRVLNAISKFWFDRTRDIVPNHMIGMPDPNVMVVQKCRPIPVEIVVRGYLCGSLWRDYACGKRTKCGASIADGLSENSPLPQPIVTPTLKNEEDTEVTPDQLLADGIVTPEQWEQLVRISLQLYERGCELAKERGLILVDTKYEFGFDENDALILIDELHTPDSSRYWEVGSIGKFGDKELVRRWLLENGNPDSLSEEIIAEASARYRRLYEQLMGQPLAPLEEPPGERLVSNLVRSGLISGFFVVAIGSHEVDLVGAPHVSLPDGSSDIGEYEESTEPVFVVSEEAVNTKWPVLIPSDEMEMPVA